MSKEFFNLIENSELWDSAYDYLLSLCDGASYLYGYRTNDEFDFEFEACGTDCEEIISDVIQKERNESWGMYGTIYTFAMTDRVKRVIKKYGLDGIIRIGNKYLENLTLYSSGKCLYSVCSHEGYTSVDGDFEEKVSDYCAEKATELPVYKVLDRKFSNYGDCNIEKLKKESEILGSLLNYVQEACNAVIRFSPRYKISYSEYVALAEKYLSENVVAVLKSYNGFEELHPQGYPKSFKETEKFKFVPGFESSDIYNNVKEQLDILKLVWYNHGINIFSDSNDGFPSIIITDK